MATFLVRVLLAVVGRRRDRLDRESTLRVRDAGAVEWPDGTDAEIHWEGSEQVGPEREVLLETICIRGHGHEDIRGTLRYTKAAHARLPHPDNDLLTINAINEKLAERLYRGELENGFLLHVDGDASGVLLLEQER